MILGISQLRAQLITTPPPQVQEQFAMPSTPFQQFIFSLKMQSLKCRASTMLQAPPPTSHKPISSNRINESDSFLAAMMKLLVVFRPMRSILLPFPMETASCLSIVLVLYLLRRGGRCDKSTSVAFTCFRNPLHACQCWCVGARSKLVHGVASCHLHCRYSNYPISIGISPI